MTLNVSLASSSSSSSTSSSACGHDMSSWDLHMNQMYTYFYLLVFIPGLLLNTTALWVLCRHISKKTKAVIFMINLALADLAHILSLPLRIYYYFNQWWPFGLGPCLFCFYLKYFNMYASIVFLVCISVQRCVFLLHPFSARRWRRRYDLAISAAVWVVVGVACSPFILMRSSSSDASPLGNASLILREANAHVTAGLSPLLTPLTAAPPAGPTPTTTHEPPPVGCFKDLPTRRLSLSLAVTMVVLAVLFGFFIPLACITYSSVRIARSLNRRPDRLSSTSDRPGGPANAEKRRALRMVLACFALFLVCFAPYHLNFVLFMMVSQKVLSHCGTTLVVMRFHPLSLCLANLSCCLNPLLYYFLTAEFRLHLTKRTSSVSSSILSSPPGSRGGRSGLMHRLMSMESTCSESRDHRS